MVLYEEQARQKRSVPGPKDRSLEAYKAWILEIKNRLTKESSRLELSEDEWIASWKEYWKERSDK